MEITKENLLKAWIPEKIKKEAEKIDCKNCYIKGYKKAFNDILNITGESRSETGDS